MMKANQYIKAFLLISILGLSATSCKKFMEFKPEGETLAEDALQNADDMQMLLNSCYDVMANTWNGRAQVLNELLGPNLIQPLNNDDLKEVYNRSTIFFNGTLGSFFGDPYIAIYRANTLFDNFDNVAMDDATRTRMQGEAYFIRGLCHWELVRKFAQPYGYTTDNSHPGIAIAIKPSNEPLTRSTVAQVYAQIISDIKTALPLLPEENDVYATKYAAQALLAKIYFQMNRFEEAADYANQVITSGKYSLSDTVNRFVDAAQSELIFKMISKSAIDNRARFFVDNFRSDGPQVPQLRVSPAFYSLATLVASDKRAQFIKVVNPGTANEYYSYTKFNGDYFSVPVLHLTEMHLLRAECYAMLNQNLNIAIDDINTIRQRAYGGSINQLQPGSSAQLVLEAVRSERLLEMFPEGDLTQELKRRGALGEPITIRNATWNCPGMVLQIPISDRTKIFELNPEGGCN